MNKSKFYADGLDLIDMAINQLPDYIVFVGGDTPRDDQRQADMIALQKASRARGQEAMWVKNLQHVPMGLKTFGKPGIRYVLVDLDELTVSDLKQYL